MHTKNFSMYLLKSEANQALEKIIILKFFKYQIN